MNRKPFYKRIKNGSLYAGALIAVQLVSIIPRPVGLFLFGWLGAFSFLLTKKEREHTLSHLSMIYGKEWSRTKITKTALEVFRGLGKNLYDAVYFSRASREDFNRVVDHDSLEGFKKAYDRGKGVIVLTAHVGCFELLLHFFAIRGYKTLAVGRKMFDAGLERLIRQTRSGDNIKYVDRTEGTLKMVRLLRNGRVFGILIDQDTRVEGVFAPFLGHPAYTPSGPVKLAMKLGVPAFVITTARRSDNTHYIYISNELEFENTGDFDSDLIKNVETANKIICDKIRQFPSQWVWMHRRWRRKPPVDTVMESSSA